MERVYKIWTPYKEDYVHVEAPHLQCCDTIARLVAESEGLNLEDVTVEDRTHEFHSL